MDEKLNELLKDEALMLEMEAAGLIEREGRGWPITEKGWWVHVKLGNLIEPH